MRALKYVLCHFPPEGTLTPNKIIIESTSKKQKGLHSDKNETEATKFSCVDKKWLARYVTSFAPTLNTVMHYVFSNVKMVISV